MLAYEFISLRLPLATILLPCRIYMTNKILNEKLLGWLSELWTSSKAKSDGTTL